MKKITKLTTFIFVLIMSIFIYELSSKEIQSKHYQESNSIEYLANINKPSKPTFSDLPTTNDEGYIYVKCISYPNSNPRYNNTRTHAGYVSLANSTAGLSIGEVIPNDGHLSYATIEEYPWMSEITIDSNYFLNMFNKSFAAKEGTHYLNNPNEKVKIYMFSNGDNWYFDDAEYPITIWTTHTEKEVSYKITREYYINGEKIATVTIADKIGRVGESINIQELVEKNPAWSTRKVEEEQVKFLFKNSLPEEELILKEDVENEIVLRYEKPQFSDYFHLTMQASNKTPYVGEVFKFTIKLENYGILKNSNAIIIDKLDEKLDFVSASDNGKYDSETHTVIWSNIFVPENGSKELVLFVKANNDGEVTNRVTAKIAELYGEDYVDIKVQPIIPKISVFWYDGYSENSLIKTIDILKGTDYSSDYPQDPEREGYEFVRWGEPEVDSDDNIHITAEWKPLGDEDYTPEKPNDPSNKDEEEKPTSPNPEEKNPITADYILAAFTIAVISLITYIIFTIKKRNLTK